jgi:peptidoglycan/LPS O-acetylase OafA/YrhL
MPARAAALASSIQPPEALARGGLSRRVLALAGAFVAVDVFFVLSGFFLAVGLSRSLTTDQAIHPPTAVGRRTWRLLPVLVVVLLATLSTTLLYAPIDRADVTRQMVPGSAFPGNLAFAAEGVHYFEGRIHSSTHGPWGWSCSLR